MKKFFYLLLILLLSAVGFSAWMIVMPMADPPLVGVQGNYALTHVNVISIQDGHIQNDRTVWVEDGKILDISPSDKAGQRDGFTEISAKGNYVIPALWDMHTHGLKISPQLHHPLFIAHGVTMARDMSGCLNEADNYWACVEDRLRWNAESENGTRVSPRYVLQSSYQTNGGNEVPEGYPDFFRLQNREHAKQLIEFYKGKQVEFIKPYTELTLEQYDDLAHFAALENMEIAGHKPLSVSLSHAIQAGQTSIEHGRLFLFDCFTDIEEFRALDNPIQHFNANFMRRMLQEQDEATCQQLMQSMASSKTWWTPTLTTLQMGALANDDSFRNDSRLDYIPFVAKQLIWFPDADNSANRGWDDGQTYVPLDFFAQSKVHVKEAHRQGVKLLAGTDNTDTYVFTGSSLHDELKMMVDAGLTPLEALQTATILPARFANLEHESGSVEQGKRADLVLLQANPLEDIRNLEQIEGVVFNGHYYDKDALDQLKQFAKEMAQSIQANIRFVWDALSSPLMRVQFAD